MLSPLINTSFIPTLDPSRTVTRNCPCNRPASGVLVSIMWGRHAVHALAANRINTKRVHPWILCLAALLAGLCESKHMAPPIDRAGFAWRGYGVLRRSV